MHVTFQLTHAITWKIVEELLRRHGTAKRLSVLETHPGGGQYDCLSMLESQGPFPGRHLCDFNQQSQHLHLWDSMGKPDVVLEDLRWPDGNDYVQAFLVDPQRTIDQVEALLGLPRFGKQRHPSSTPAILTVRVISTILNRHALGNRNVQARSGWFDTSGSTCSDIRGLLRAVPEIAAGLPSARGSEHGLMAYASRFWCILQDAPSKNRWIVLDLQGPLYSQASKGTSWNIWEEYQHNGRRLRPIVSKAEEMLFG